MWAFLPQSSVKLIDSPSIRRIWSETVPTIYLTSGKTMLNPETTILPFSSYSRVWPSSISVCTPAPKAEYMVRSATILPSLITKTSMTGLLFTECINSTENSEPSETSKVLYVFPVSLSYTARRIAVLHDVKKMVTAVTAKAITAVIKRFFTDYSAAGASASITPISVKYLTAPAWKGTAAIPSTAFALSSSAPLA